MPPVAKTAGRLGVPYPSRTPFVSGVLIHKLSQKEKNEMCAENDVFSFVSCFFGIVVDEEDEEEADVGGLCCCCCSTLSLLEPASLMIGELTPIATEDDTAEIEEAEEGGVGSCSSPCC